MCKGAGLISTWELDPPRLGRGDLELDVATGRIWLVIAHRADCLGEDCDCDRQRILLGRAPCADWDLGQSPPSWLSTQQDASYQVLLEEYALHLIESAWGEHPSLTAAERN